MFALVAGCSADGSGAIDDDQTPTDPEPQAQLPPPSGGGDAAPSDDGGKPKTDAGKDGSVDAGPPPPVPGTPCTVPDEVRKKKCGACGEQGAICLAGADGGAATWSEYSACENELAGGCIPGTVVDEACGNCGTRKKTCTAYCAFTTAACTGQPASSCVPGNVDLSNAGCGVADTYRQRTCQANCTYNSFGGTCTAPPTTVPVGPTVGSVTSTIAFLDANNVMGRLSGTCPNATVGTAATAITPAVHLQVHNPLTKPATVAIYNSLAPGGTVIKTYMAAYEGAAVPTTEAARKACLKGVSTLGTASLTGDSKFASLDSATRQVTLAPGATVTVYVGAFSAYDATKPAESTGKVKLNVQTLAVGP
ncbi:MAG: hypothetical protein KF819_28160 [Labilithrix sp.]|nr:hypothetical protein [Labilithrix sp.]